MKREPYTKAPQRQEEGLEARKARLIAVSIRQERLAENYLAEEAGLLKKRAALILKGDLTDAQARQLDELDKQLKRRYEKRAHALEKVDAIDKQIWESGIRSAAAL